MFSPRFGAHLLQVVIINENGVTINNNSVIINDNGVIINDNGVIINDNGVIFNDNGVIITYKWIPLSGRLYSGRVLPFPRAGDYWGDWLYQTTYNASNLSSPCCYLS